MANPLVTSMSLNKTMTLKLPFPFWFGFSVSAFAAGFSYKWKSLNPVGAQPFFWYSLMFTEGTVSSVRKGPVGWGLVFVRMHAACTFTWSWDSGMENICHTKQLLESNMGLTKPFSHKPEDSPAQPPSNCEVSPAWLFLLREEGQRQKSEVAVSSSGKGGDEL